MLSCCYDGNVKRTQIQLEEPIFETLRQIAFQKKTSVAAVMREMIGAQVSPKQKSKLRLEDFTFIGSGRSRGKGTGSIAERHDEEFADSIL